MNEQRLLILLLVLASVFRLWQLSFASIEHFDEGVYASNFWFGAGENYRYPDRHLYAPPILPSAIEWGHVLFGPGVLACFLPSLLAGIVSVYLVWLFLRRISGPVSGLVGASLWGFSDFAILYSRTALTESLLCCLMLSSVLLAERALSSYRDEWAGNVAKPGLAWFWPALGSGLFAGFAWLTKYNGWLTLAVIFSATPTWLVLSRASGSVWKKSLGVLGVTGTSAALLWWPYLSSLQSLGGYESVSANHRKYFVGLSGWGNSFQEQWNNLYQLSSPLAFVVPLLLLPFLLFRLEQKSADVVSDSDSNRLPIWKVWLNQPGSWLIASWWTGLGVAIPLYYPYPRLLLPWVLASCLFAGLLASSVTGLFERFSGNLKSTLVEFMSARKILPGYWVFVASFLVLLTGYFSFATGAPAWQDRRGLKQIAEQFTQVCGEIARNQGLKEDQVIIYVYGEPGLFYHFSAQGRLTGPIGHLDFAGAPKGRIEVPVFLVTGPHAESSDLFKEQWSRKKEYFQLIDQASYKPSRFVLLNQPGPDFQRRPELPVLLYQVKPPENQSSN